MEEQLLELEDGEKPPRPEPGEARGEEAIDAAHAAFSLFGWALASVFIPFVNIIAFPIFLVRSMATALAGMVRSVLWLFVAVGSGERPSARFAARVIGAGLMNGLALFLGFLLTGAMTSMFRRGRQLRQGGKVLLPDVLPGETWTTLATGASVTGEVTHGLAAQWRENGRTEHASVGAFARLTLDLMALGAPPALIAAANRDALEEIRHAELCFSLARDLDGHEESPGPFPAAATARTLLPGRTLALAALAVDSLVDGALHEGVSARVIARVAKVCEEPKIRAMLREIAADEGRHAAHGWDVVQWCVKEGGEPVVASMRGALAALPAEMLSPLPEEAAAGEWERYGIYGHAMEGEEYRKAVADLERRVAAMAD